MKKCRETKSNMVSFLGKELDPERCRRIKKHLAQCPSCQKEMNELEIVLKSARAVEPELKKAMSSVDWDRLPDKISEKARKEFSPPEKIRARRQIPSLFLQPWFKPVTAALFAGLVLGVFSTLLFIRPFERGSERINQFTAPRDFLERVEIEMARREAIDYLDKSQLLLLEFIQSTPDSPSLFWQEDLSEENVRNLLSKKKYIDPQLDKFKMVKAKAICDQVELLFYELARMRDAMTDEEIQEIQNYIQEKQLLLRINLVKKELEKNDM